jgi:lysozyme
MKVNNAGIELIKSYEKLYLRAYDDFKPSLELTASTVIKGTLTVGYGSTGSWVKWNTIITREKAEQLLNEDIAKAEAIVKRLLKVELNDNQYSALVSFAFNTGGGYIGKDKKWHPYELWSWINAGKDVSEKWITTAITSKGKPLRGLVNRRTAEYQLYSS